MSSTTFNLFFSLVVIVFLFFILYCVTSGKKRINAMSPSERNTLIYGPVNATLVCPHCQIRGNVHVKKIMKVITSTGKIGGILKTNMENTTKNLVTQHHCEQCTSTWEI